MTFEIGKVYRSGAGRRAKLVYLTKPDPEIEGAACSECLLNRGWVVFGSFDLKTGAYLSSSRVDWDLVAGEAEHDRSRPAADAEDPSAIRDQEHKPKLLPSEPPDPENIKNWPVKYCESDEEADVAARRYITFEHPLQRFR